MKILKRIVIAIHIVAVVTVMVLTLIADHAVTGKSFYKCERFDDNIYIAEEASGFSVLYRGDFTGDVKGVYKSNMDRSKTTITDFSIVDDSLFVLERCGSDYVIKELSREDFSVFSKTKPFVLRDTDYVCDFRADLSDTELFITAVGREGTDARVYGYKRSELIPVGSDALKLQSGEPVAELSPIYRQDATNTVIITAYFDGFNIITTDRPPTENTVSPYSYAGNITLKIEQSLKINSEVLLIYFAYGITGLVIIILFMRIIERRRRFIDLILLNEIFIIASMIVGIFLLDNTVLSISWAGIASIANILVILYENRDVSVLCEDMNRISTGNLDLDKPQGSSMEVATLWRGMNEVKYLYEEYRYIRDTTTAAALRFLPHNIGNMFKSNSLDEIKPGDSTTIVGTFMTFRTKKDISNDLISKTEDYEKKAEGTLLTGECSASQIRMLFPKPESNAVEEGLYYISEMQDDSACALYFKDRFKFSVVGTATKSILNIYSLQLETMERMAEWFFELGIRMVVSEDVKGLSGRMKSPLRYIGYCYIGGEKTSFYEVLDIYPEKIRSARLKCLEDFGGALNLIYQNDYYLARTAFSDILKVDPTDELSRWYLFICEKYLNNPELTDKPCTLDPRN